MREPLSKDWYGLPLSSGTYITTRDGHTWKRPYWRYYWWYVTDFWRFFRKHGGPKIMMAMAILGFFIGMAINCWVYGS